MDDSGGFDANFVEPPPNELMCPVCTCVVKNPIQISNCGHRLCSACYTSLKKFSGECLCPTDRTVIKDDQVFPDIGTGRRVMSLKVKCEYFTKGCVWVGELRDLQMHVDDCCYESVDGEVYYIDEQVHQVDDQTHLQVKLTKLETSLELKDTEIGVLKRQVEKLRNQLQSSLKTMSTLEEKYKTLLIEYNELRCLKKQLLNSSKAVDNKRKSEEVELGKLRKYLSSNTSKLQSLSARFDNKIKNLDKLEGIVKMAYKIPDMEKSIQVLETKADSYCEQMKTVTDKQKSEEIESVKLRKVVIKAHIKLQNLTDRFDNKVKNIDKLNENVNMPMEKFCTSIKVLERKIDDYHDEIENFKTKKDLEENLKTNKYMEENLKTKKGLEENLKTKKGVEENLKTKKGLERNFKTKKGLEENLKAKKALKNDDKTSNTKNLKHIKNFQMF